MSIVFLYNRLQLLQIERNDFGGQRNLLLFLDLIIGLIGYDSDLFINIKGNAQFFLEEVEYVARAYT